MQPFQTPGGFRQMGVRRFGRVTWLGLFTLARREVMRFMNVWQQTVLAPLMTAGLFVVVFALALGKGRGEVMGLPYLAFLGPGILAIDLVDRHNDAQTGFQGLFKNKTRLRQRPL